MPLLTRLPPESAHRLGLATLEALRPLWPKVDAPATLAVQCAGLRFAHPLGLAAGFDKNADHLDALGALGFSHVEIGTVTPRPQAGNPRPRMFRIRAAGALVNRMGFNNAGAEHVAARLARSRYGGVRGVSIGKNFDTPIENAAEDYLRCFERLYDHAGYFAINVSSPNTARLRELQAREGLARILGPLLERRERLAGGGSRRVPIFVKIAPDLQDEQIDDLAAQLPALGADGVIATNTSNRLERFATALPAGASGGLSGRPLHRLSVAAIRRLRAGLPPGFPIVGVGGIGDAAAALETLAAGATLIQVYTGFAYRGPELIEEILDGIAG
ncbi:MAG: quinone-dependent dihydroorotate dehydrogenase [Gammaproteobacteria bacterium]|nr:quinone-dependent dihydroorotate dehydrogenase [Gammaproteobacteria bacterium]